MTPADSALRHWILDGHELKEVDLFEWARWFEKSERHVGQDEIGEARVSTVFLGIDHNFDSFGPPILFETMVFGGPHDQWCARYATWDEAAAGHAAVVQALRDGRDPESVR